MTPGQTGLTAHEQQQQQNMSQLYGGHGMNPPPLNEAVVSMMAMQGAVGPASVASQQDDSSMLDDDSKHDLELPPDYAPCPDTVIVGRGKKVAQHPGNVRFRAYVKEELEEYSAATTKAHKSSIILRVLTRVRDKSHYAFVKQNLATGRWSRVEEASQRITTAQAFRDALKDNYKSSRAHKKLKREEEKEMKVHGGGGGGAGAGEGDDSVSEGGGEKTKKRKAAASRSKKPKATASKRAARPSAANSIDSAHVGTAVPSQGQDPADPAAALRKLLEQNQNALLSGQARLWNTDAPITLAAPSAATAAAIARGSAGAIPSNSARSQQAALDRALNWSYNSGLGNLSNHSALSIGSGHQRNLFNRSLTGPGGLNLSNHSMLSLSRHSNFSGISNFSGHSTGTFTGLMSKFAPRSGAELSANPYEPRPIPGSAAAAAAAAAAVGGAVGMGDAVDVEMMDVPMGLATARPAFDPTVAALGGLYGTDAHTSAAGVLAAAQQSQFANAQAHAHAQAAHALTNLSDHSLMSDFSSIHSRNGYNPSAEEIFQEMDRSRRRQLEAMLP